jgi:hypothetical protein
MELFGSEGEKILKWFLQLFLLVLLFLLFGKVSNLVFCSFLHEFDFWIVAISDVFLVVSLAVEDAVDVFQHFL